MSSVIDTARAKVQSFANKHKVVFEDHGSVGFGRPCVGLTKGSGYVDFNPHRYAFKPFALNPDIETIEELYDRRLGAPDSVADAYHKHDCLAVLVKSCEACDDADERCPEHYDAAILQLADWVAHLESIGAEVVTYETGRQGVHLLVGGPVAYAVRSTDGKPWKRGQSPPSPDPAPATSEGRGDG